jgi:peroxiredoxin
MRLSLRHFLHLPLHFSAAILLLLSSQSLSAVEQVPSYQQSLDKFMAERKAKKSSMTAADKAVMKNFFAQLAKDLPAPGIKVGEKAPDFILNNAFGKTVKLSDELRKGPVVLVFYRGAWCPFCNLHLHALQKTLPQIKHYGAQLMTVSPQKPDKSAKQFTEDQFTFEVLSDSDSQVMRDYRLYFEMSKPMIELYKGFDVDLEDYNGEGRTVLPVPGSFVIDQDGVVQAMQAQTDYKKRMEPKAIISALQKIAANF